jgi:hypothetical protein
MAKGYPLGLILLQQVWLGACDRSKARPSVDRGAVAPATVRSVSPPRGIAPTAVAPQRLHG